nr:copia protein [Tanacetum cinerariifolium]
MLSRIYFHVLYGRGSLHQAKPTEKHLKEVKRIFRYLRGTVNTGLWYTKDSGFELTGFSDADYAGCKDSFKNTSGGAQFLGEKLVSWFSKKQDCTTLLTAEAEYMSLSACCAQVLWMRTQLTDYGFNFTKIPIYCDSKSAITICCNPVQHSRTKHIAVRYHFIKEHVEKGTIELVLDLENTKITKRNEIASLKSRVKKLKKTNRSRTHRLKRLYKVGLTARVESSRDKESLGEDASKQGRIDDIDTDKNITLVSVQDNADKEMFNVNVLDVSTAATTVTITTKEITLAQALKALKTSKPKVKGIVIQEPGKSTTTTTIISSQQSQDKCKGIMIEEPVKPKKKDQIRLDEEAAKKLQAEFDEEERLAREKAKKEQRANIALIEE